MCLDKLSKVTVKQGVGYKVFNSDGWYHPTTRWQGFTTKRFPIGKWVNEKDWRLESGLSIIESGDLGKYKTGFHLYKEERNSFLVVRKVRFRNVCAEGVQGGKRVIVAKEILIERLK